MQRSAAQLFGARGWLPVRSRALLFFLVLVAVCVPGGDMVMDLQPTVFAWTMGYEEHGSVYVYPYTISLFG